MSNAVTVVDVTVVDVTVVELAVPSASELERSAGSDGKPQPSWVMRGIKQAVRAEQSAILGHTDFVSSEASSISRFPLQQYRHLRYLVALDGPPETVVGTSTIGLPLVPAVARAGDPDGDPDRVLGHVLLLAGKTDNTHLLELDGVVHPDHRAASDALWQQTLRVAQELGRRTLIDYHTQPADGREEPSDLVPPTGFGRIHRDGAVATRLARGFDLQQCERISTMTVPGTARIDAWIAQARGRAGDGYRTTTWHGPTPAPLRSDLAELFRRMSVDVPSGDLEYEEETWDEERVQARDAEVTASGHIHLTTVIHDADGAPAAFSVLNIPLDATGYAYQDETLVHGDHRGRRLGLLAKAVNLHALTEFRPDVERIHTWNAGENAHMLAINDAMGFRATGWEGVWQLRLPVTGVPTT